MESLLENFPSRWKISMEIFRAAHAA